MEVAGCCFSGEAEMRVGEISAVSTTTEVLLVLEAMDNMVCVVSIKKREMKVGVVLWLPGVI